MIIAADLRMLQIMWETTGMHVYLFNCHLLGRKAKICPTVKQFEKQLRWLRCPPWIPCAGHETRQLWRSQVCPKHVKEWQPPMKAQPSMARVDPHAFWSCFRTIGHASFRNQDDLHCTYGRFPSHLPLMSPSGQNGGLDRPPCWELASPPSYRAGWDRRFPSHGVANECHHKMLSTTQRINGISISAMDGSSFYHHRRDPASHSIELS